MLWSRVLFGFTLSGTTATIYAGEIAYNQTLVAVAETDLTIAAPDSIAYVQMAWETGAATVRVTTTPANTISDATYYRTALHGFDKISTGNVRHTKLFHVGRITLTGQLFGAP